MTIAAANEYCTIRTIAVAAAVRRAATTSKAPNKNISATESATAAIMVAMANERVSRARFWNIQMHTLVSAESTNAWTKLKS